MRVWLWCVQYALDRAQRPAALDSWPHRVHNQLMFLPDSDTSRAISRVGQVTAGTDAPADRASERVAMGAGSDAALAITDGAATSDPPMEAAPPRGQLLLTGDGEGGSGSGGAGVNGSLLGYRPRSSGASVALALPSGTLLKDNGGIAPPKEILRTNTRFAGNFLESQVCCRCCWHLFVVMLLVCEVDAGGGGGCPQCFLTVTAR